MREQLPPGAPWRIRLTDESRARFVEQAPPDYLPMLEATMKLGDIVPFLIWWNIGCQMVEGAVCGAVKKLTFVKTWDRPYNWDHRDCLELF